MIPMITGIKNKQGAVNQTEVQKLHGGISILLTILSDAGAGSKTRWTRADWV